MPRPPRYPRFPYRGPTLYPNQIREGMVGRLMQDAVSGAWFNEVFAVEGPYGLVDGRDGGTLDLGTEEQQMTPDNVTRPPL